MREKGARRSTWASDCFSVEAEHENPSFHPSPALPTEQMPAEHSTSARGWGDRGRVSRLGADAESPGESGQPTTRSEQPRRRGAEPVGEAEGGRGPVLRARTCLTLKRVLGKPYLSSSMIGADQTSCNLVMIPAAHPVIAKPKCP
jgi:hypothetical protein